MPSRPIHQILSDRPFVGVSADTPVREVVRQMNALQRSAALVTEHGVLTGIFTERDAAFGVLAAGLDAAEGVAASVCYGLVVLLSTLPGAFVLQRHKPDARSAPEATPTCRADGP